VQNTETFDYIIVGAGSAGTGYRRTKFHQEFKRPQGRR
jgi:hypothetical protein